MRRSAASRRALAATFLATLVLGTLTGFRDARGAELRFETQYARLVLDDAGRARSLVELATGRELLRRGDEPFVIVQAAGKRSAPTGLEQRDGRVEVHFADPRLGLALRITSAPSHLVVSVEELRGAGIESVEFARLPVAVDENVGSILPVRWDHDFAVAMVGAHENVETVANRAGIMASAVYAEPGLAPAAAAILTAPTAVFADAMQETEVALGLPSPRLDHVPAKLSPSARRSYLFVDLTESNVDEVIRWAHMGGFAMVLVYANTWSESAGSYRVNHTNFPGGEAGLAATIRRAHDAGLKVGLHCLTSLVAKRDPIASPRPDPRLLKDATAKLARDLAAGATDVVLEGTSGVLARNPEQGLGTDVQLDDEIVRYRSVDPSADGRTVTLVGCERGANGTRPAAHAAGAAVQHLAERHGSYLADLRTSLPSEIADRLAGVVDRFDADMIYLDAGEANEANGPFWYWGGHQQEEVLRRIHRPIVVQGSGTTAFTWHRFTRGTCDDDVAVGRDAWLEVHKIGQLLPYYRRNQMPAELGWWGVQAAAPGRRATTIAEAETLGARSLALDVPFSVETTLASLAANPDAEPIFETLARFERARFEHTAPGTPPVVAARAERPSGEQTSQLLVQATAPSPVVLAVPAAAKVPAGTLATRFALDAGALSPRRWLAALAGAPSGLDLSRYDALAITIRVDGPALGADQPAPVLDFQLETAARRYRDHLVDLDFRGERTLRLEGSAARVIRELPPAPGTYPLKSSLLDADLARTRALNVRWMRGATIAGLTVRVERVEALSGSGAAALQAGPVAAPEAAHHAS